ncbi:hypothetical protein [Bacterioplanes sanyensis]|nr:hypothetical protein [Bacterioplanes sanyensis]
MDIEPMDTIQEPELTEQRLRHIHIAAAVSSAAMLVLSFILTATF